MKIERLIVKNFRGIKFAHLLLPNHVVLIGDNNTGKSTVLEAINLVLGPDRLNRRVPIDEHDFYFGHYLSDPSIESAASSGNPEMNNDESTSISTNNAETENETVEHDETNGLPDLPQIDIEVTIADLSDEQRARFRNYIEWWDEEGDKFYTSPIVEGVDSKHIFEAIRVTFLGKYVVEEDDFDGKTYFTRSLEESNNPQSFTRQDKQFCGFLYLRGLRTGRRALSLEHGSLLDIILRLKEIRPQMWETTISGLSKFDVASDPDLGISGVLKSINTELKKYVPKEWGIEPHLRVSNLTRNHLRDLVTAFIPTGEGNHSAPYYRQGAGTINMLVLAMLSQIAEDKQNVIFAMEEPEIAIPPYAQKRIVHELRKLSAQSIFTSHSPFVLEEFDLSETVVLSRSKDGQLTQKIICLPDSVKHKRFRQEFRARFCEGLLSRRILLAEGAAEASAFPAVARHLAEINPTSYSSLEALGICTIDAGGQSQIADLASLYKSIGKTVYAVCDEQSESDQATIESQVDQLFMHPEKGFEALVLKNTSLTALKRFAALVIWPQHLQNKYPKITKDIEDIENIEDALSDYFQWTKGNWGIADFLTQCTEDEIPTWLCDRCSEIRKLIQPTKKQSKNIANSNCDITDVDASEGLE